MPSKLLITGLLVSSFAVLFQLFLKDTFAGIWIGTGIGLPKHKIEEFPYACRRLVHPLLDSCEDLVIDAEGRKVYAACSNVVGRAGWAPGGNRYNVSARDLKDHVAVLNIDEPGEDGFFGVHELEVTGNYKSSSGGKDMDFIGIEIEDLGNGRLRFFLVNYRPPVDDQGNILEAKKIGKVGANATIETFELARGSTKLEHVRTVLSDAVFMPNNIAATGDGGFVVSNCRDSKVEGLLGPLSLVLGGGNVAYCSPTSKCHIASPPNYKFAMANGVIKGHDGLYYVAQSSSGKIAVFSLQPETNTFLKVNEISIGMPVDNLSIDTNGDIWVAAFPVGMMLLMATDNPLEVDVPSAVFRIRKVKGEEGYEVKMVLEDIEGKTLPGSTGVVHDAKTGKLFLGGVTSNFVTVCEPKA